MERKSVLEEALRKSPPGVYKDVVARVVEVIGGVDYDDPDPDQIHEIDDGDYQGTLVYVIGAGGYQPSTYWAVSVGYGSCSTCDTLQGVLDEPDPVPGLMTLALHVVQGLKEI
jgi:hypothetical protein